MLNLFLKIIVVSVMVKHTAISKNGMDFRKINKNGDYLSFYGYTCIAMMNSNLQIAENIENYIKNSSLKRFYSALPATSFHMTIFNIYSCGDTLIPPVRDWLEQNNETLSCTNGLPDQLLYDQHLKASNVIKDHIHEKLSIEGVEFYLRPGNIGLLVRLSFQDGLIVQSLRKDLSSIYKHDDVNLSSLNKMHITLAYGYRESNYDDDFNKDISVLKNMCLKLNNTQLDIPQIYAYKNMTKYIPFSTVLN